MSLFYQLLFWLLIRVSHFSFLLMNMLQRANVAKDRINSIVAAFSTKKASMVPSIIIRLAICNDVINVAVLIINDFI